MYILERVPRYSLFFFFFFNDTATTEIYTLSLHDALPISVGREPMTEAGKREIVWRPTKEYVERSRIRSEEHTSELQSLAYLVCRLLLEKKKKKKSSTSPMNKSIMKQTRTNTELRMSI